METQCAKSCKLCSSFNNTHEPDSTTEPGVVQQSTGKIKNKTHPSVMSYIAYVADQRPLDYGVLVY